MKFFSALCRVYLLFSFCAAAAADTIYLANGDRLTGDFTGLRDGALYMTTTYAGELTVQQSEAIALETDEPWTVHMADGEAYDGQLTWQEGALAVQAGDARTPLTMDGVGAIVPLGEEPPAPADAAVEEDEKEKIWSGTADLGMIIKSGTTDTTDISAKLQFVRTRPNHKLTLTASGIYGEVESEVNTRRYLGNAELRLTPWEHFYTFGYTGVEHDAGRQLEYRWTTGAGVGYTVFETERRLLELEAGLEYAQEEWNLYSLKEEDRVREQIRAANIADTRRFLLMLRNNPMFTFANARAFGRLLSDVSNREFDNGSRREDDMNLRFGAHFEQQVFEKSRFFADFTYVPAVDDWADYRFVSDLAWQTPLAKGLSLRLNLLSEYESEPEGISVENWENTFTTSLRYEF